MNPLPHTPMNTFHPVRDLGLKLSGCEGGRAESESTTAGLLPPKERNELKPKRLIIMNVRTLRTGALGLLISLVSSTPVLAADSKFDAVFKDGALWKHGNVGQGIYIDPARDFVGVYYSTNGYIPPYGEDKMPGYLRRAAKFLNGE